MGDKPPRMPPLDLDALARDYRTGAFTDRELGDKYQRSHTYIQKVAKREGWQKDLKRAVEVATQAKMAEIEVGKTKNPDVAKKIRKQIESALPATAEVVAALAEVNTQVLMRHRTDIRALRDLCFSTMADLRARSEQERTAEPPHMIAIKARADVLRLLTDNLCKLIQSERVCYGQDTGADPQQPPPKNDAPPAEHYRWLASQKASS
jgi:hypothetical protein